MKSVLIRELLTKIHPALAYLFVIAILDAVEGFEAVLEVVLKRVQVPDSSVLLL